MGRAIILTGKGVGGGGGGNVSGPASSTLNAIARYADTTGKVIKDSNVTLADSGTALVFSGAAGLTATGASNPVTLTPGSGGRTDISVGNLTFDTITNGTGRIQFPVATTSAGGITFGANLNLFQASATTLALNHAGGTNPNFQFQESGTNSLQIQTNSGAAFIDASKSGGNLTFRTNGTTTALALDSSQGITTAKKIVSYNGVATSGWGVPSIQNAGRVTAQTNSAAASFSTYTVGAADGSFVISCNVLITTSTTFNFTVVCVYTDEGNTSRTLTLNVSQLTGTFITAITNVTGAGAYEGVPVHIRCKASTAITLSTAAGGVYTGVVFNAEGSIRQIA